MSNSDSVEISVVISTYNRCAILPATIESILRQRTPELTYEVIIVDNNSTDATKQVVEWFVGRGHRNVRYVFEAKQGPSHGRNAGIANAKGEIIAFTDDDVCVEKNWLLNIKRAFDSYTNVDCVGGKILPLWTSETPVWLTTDHWSPLAIADYGDRIILPPAKIPICWSTSNISFRARVFERIGGFNPDFIRSQDRELMWRFLRDGGQPVYVPDVVVTTDVPAVRLTKAYHRAWHKTTGKYHALMRLYERTGPDGSVLDKPMETARLFGVPGFLYRELMNEGWRWLLAVFLRHESHSFKHENRIRYLLAYMDETYHRATALQKGGRFREVLRFLKALLTKRTHSPSH